MSHVYFTDRDLGKRFPSILSATGLTVERHHELFPPDGSDEQWLEYCGKNNRIALSHNERIRYTTNELAAVVRHNVRLMIINEKNPFPVQAENFVRTLPRIEAFIADAKAPYIAKIYRPTNAELAKNPDKPGTVLLWFPK